MMLRRTMTGVRVFISHARADHPLALHLAETLTASEPGVEVDTSDGVRPDERPQEHAREAMASADVIVLLIGPEAGEATRNEWSEALTTSFRRPETTILPILLRDAEVPGFLHGGSYLTLDDNPVDLRSALAESAFKWTATPVDRDAHDRRLARVEELAAQLPSGS